VVLGKNGPFIVHNCTQATARDVLMGGMRRLERAGYPIVLHVHDEMIAETPEDFGDTNEFRRIMCEPEPWTTGLPITAGEPFRDVRYSKS
jgi:DNA polymerase